MSEHDGLSDREREGLKDRLTERFNAWAGTN